MNLKPRLVRMPFSFLYNRLYRYVRNHYSIELYYTVTVGRRVVIGHQGAIIIHDRAEIGDEWVIRQGVTLGASMALRRHANVDRTPAAWRARWRRFVATTPPLPWALPCS